MLEEIDLIVDRADARFIEQMAAVFNTDPADMAGEIIAIGMAEKKEATKIAESGNKDCLIADSIFRSGL